MHPPKNTDQFDAFRRERKRVQAKLGPQASVLGYENNALRELEQVEAREVRDQQLTREVHDFFAAATRQAAAIVEKVSHDAEEQASERMQGEVEGFLIDTLARMNGFIMTVMQKRRNVNIAETHVEPDLKHLVGPELDLFRYEGTPEARDAHIGQDPFATPLEEVQREFRALVADMDGEQNRTASIDDHLVAELSDETPDYAQEEPPEPYDTKAERDADVATQDDHATHSEMLDDEPAPTVQQELESFKSALKALVRQGVMQREEARAAWNARLVSLGRAV
jgi:hypothetical protein